MKIKNSRSPLHSRIQEFCDLYPTTDTRELALRFGVTADTIRRWASQLGLEKDRQYLSDYARSKALGRSLNPRGKKLSESTKQMLREQRKGKAHTTQHRAKIAAGLRSSLKRIGRPPRSSK
jgi:Zn-dependent peptidase ImmA (M78 family)